ncbi:MAG: 2OG-Fe(II) oxygenase family protein [Actinomycetota bacterium]
MDSAFDPAAKERQLRQESDAWDTSRPVPAEPGDVPVIDLGPYLADGDPAELGRAADRLREASEEVGFWQLVGHGVPTAVTDGILDEARRFHDLPVALRRTIEMDRPGWPIGGSGYLPVGERKLPRRAQGNVNEAFLLKSDIDIDFDDNQWLPESDLPGFRATVEAYARTMEDLALRLLPVYATAFDLPADHFTPGFTDPFWRLRLTRYPPAEAAVGPDDAFGIAPHVDTTFITLLLPDGPGLTIYSHRRSCWITVPLVPGAFVVNSGELLKQWSNDRVLSTRHFANNTAPHDRYAVPFFFNATSTYPMECLPTCHGPDNPPRYPTISYRESQAAVQGE